MRARRVWELVLRAQVTRGSRAENAIDLAHQTEDPLGEVPAHLPREPRGPLLRRRLPRLAALELGHRFTRVQSVGIVLERHRGRLRRGLGRG